MFHNSVLAQCLAHKRAKEILCIFIWIIRILILYMELIFKVVTAYITSKWWNWSSNPYPVLPLVLYIYTNTSNLQVFWSITPFWNHTMKWLVVNIYSHYPIKKTSDFVWNICENEMRWLKWELLQVLFIFYESR